MAADITTVVDWDVEACIRWAINDLKLPLIIAETFRGHRIDGRKIMTFSRTDVFKLFDSISEPSRDFLWDMIAALRKESYILDQKLALQLYQLELNDSGLESSVVESITAELFAALTISDDNYEAVSLQAHFDHLQRIEHHDHMCAIDISRGLPMPANQLMGTAPVRRLPQETLLDKIHVIKSTEAKVSSDESHHAIKIDTCCVCYHSDVLGLVFDCGHTQCLECMRTVLQHAVKDASLFPPKCCGIEIVINTAVQQLLNMPAEIDSMIRRYEESSAKDKMYCPTRNCGSFINLSNATGPSVECPSCKSVSCVKCKKEVHDGSCSEDADHELDALGISQGWKKCPGCNVYIEFMEG